MTFPLVSVKSFHVDLGRQFIPVQFPGTFCRARKLVLPNSIFAITLSLLFQLLIDLYRQSILRFPLLSHQSFILHGSHFHYLQSLEYLCSRLNQLNFHLGFHSFLDLERIELYLGNQIMRWLFHLRVQRVYSFKPFQQLIQHSWSRCIRHWHCL